MKFCLIRLGKDSVNDIHSIDSRIGIQNPEFQFVLNCKQVPHDIEPGDFCFFWLGSDNNKGTPTAWVQGLRACGVVTEKTGGPSYNDDWQLRLSVGIVLNKSLTKKDLLRAPGNLYLSFSDLPVIGLNSSSNQSVQLIKYGQDGHDVSSFIQAIEKCQPGFVNLLSLKFPHLQSTLSAPVYPRQSVSVEQVNEPIEDVEDEIDPVLMKDPFNPSLINIDNKLLNIDLLIKRLSQLDPEIDLYPDFQRHGDLWNDTQKSRLIESILIRFPLPAFYFDGTNKDKWLVVDGLQRLTSLKQFVIDKTLRLTNLEFLTKLDGSYYHDLDRDLQRVIEETQVVAYIINPGTPSDVKFNIFKRINTSGLILESQEIRHALFQGRPSKLVAELAESPEFKLATQQSIRPDRMLDREFVNRFLSFYLLGLEQYTSDLDSYLNLGMRTVYSLDNASEVAVKASFYRSMVVNNQIFGKHAFRKMSSFDPRVRPINRALFDTLSVEVARLSISECDQLVARKEDVRSALVNLLEDPDFFSSISSSTNERRKVFYRFDRIKALFFQILNN